MLVRMPKTRSSRVAHASLWSRLVAAALGAPVGILILWVMVHEVPGLGPLVADTLRSVVGVDAVAKLEDIAYGVQDRLFRAFRGNEPPKARWQVPSATPAAVQPQPAPLDAEPKQEVVERIAAYHPADVGPVHSAWSAAGDGVWVPMQSPEHPSEEPFMYKTLLHPDKQRSWAELFVVALDLRRVDVHLVPGSREPEATTDEAKDVERPGRVAPEDREQVLAAFNGGFKTEHGQYGMYVGGLTYVPPKAGVCTVALFQDGGVDVATWERLMPRQEHMVWWRQAPNCMWEDGKMHVRLREGFTKRWGATLDGETVIRRSAVGVTSDGRAMLVGISNHTSAPVLAMGMHHAGAETVAQLDVNYSFPKFVTFERNDEGVRIAVALAEGFEFSEDEYIRKRAYRDFFYVMPKPAARPTAQN